MKRFDDANLRRIIGPGVTAIFCQPMGKPGASSNDHKREHVAKHGGVRFADVDGEPPCVPVWAFVIHRGDGEAVRLYPNPNQTDGRMMCVPIPTAADGPDTYTEVVPSTNTVATASSADTRGDGADRRGWQDWWGAWSSDGNRGDGADWRGWQHWRSASSSDDAWHASRGAWNSDANG